MAESLVVEVLDDGVLVIDETVVEVLEVSLPGPQGIPGQGVPAGGDANQVLTKRSGTDYDADWVTPTGGGGFAYNVKDFAAALDTIDREDGSMAIGTPLLTLPNDTELPFTNADIGKMVPGVAGAGAAGEDLKRATIIDVLSPTTAVLSKNAQATVSDARFQYGTDDTVALQVTADTARGNGRQAIYHPAGIAIYTGDGHGRGTGSLAAFAAGDKPFGYVGDDSDLSAILFGDDLADPLYQYQGRHGTPNNSFPEGGVHRDYRTMNPGKRFHGDVVNAWQMVGLNFVRVYFEEVNGRIMTLIACHSCDVDIRWKDCGRGETGDPSIVFTWSMEGGFLINDQMTTADCNLKAIGDGNDDAAVLWVGTEHCRADVDLDGSGQYRSVFYVVNGYSCRILGDIRNGSDDCVHLQSQGESFGRSAYNIVDVAASGALGMTEGTGWGIHEQKGPGMIHTGNRLTGVFHDNALGGVSP